ncbi:interleukin 2 receptor, gamma a precursor-like [Scleropages formosus]|nr:interleukin 2 receptor, gamma a precursor-like [Scleropages formosus]
MPYTLGRRFDKLHIRLSHGNISMQEIHDLRQEVKLDTPHNLSVEFKNSTGLWFSWSTIELKNCIESVVRYKKDAHSWMDSLPTQSNYFNVPLPSEYSMYTFQVKVHISSLCSSSNFWSDWSSPVSWGPVKSYDSETPEIPSISQVLIYSVLGGMILFALACVLIQYERLKVIFIPAVPNPGKNLEDLFLTYNGNVEEWLHISKEFADGFKPNFSESVCPVREYRLLPQESESSSECSLHNLTDLSDCLSTSCFSSTSTLPVPLEDTPPASV